MSKPDRSGGKAALSEAEIQLLATLASATDQSEPTGRANLARLGGRDYEDYLENWSDAFDSLAGKGLLAEQDGHYALTADGARCAPACRAERPGLWWYLYRDFFTAAPSSAAHAAFCERVYGRDLCQHGMVDMDELAKLLEVLQLAPGHRVLELGCGNGVITEHIADLTGARITGIDYAPVAIEQAQHRTAENSVRLVFQVGDMNALVQPQAAFDAAMSIDTLYFVDDLHATLSRTIPSLKPGGQMGIFFAQWLEAGDPQELLQADQTRLAGVLRDLGLSYRTWDFTVNIRRHWRLNKQASEDLKSRFEAEGNGFLYAFREREWKEFLPLVEARAISHHLYHVRL